jgi:glyoxylase-like metal-dependent hydrolase (beta-lactamase superfamily II)/rhodanese-related sulfurtransferase
MAVRSLGTAACRSYLLACERTRQCLVLDPLAEEVEETARMLEREALRPCMVIDTHTHADHHSGAAALAARFGVPYALHEATTCRRATERLRDGATVEAGDLRVEVIHTPGHTPDSVTLRCGPDLFTGDFLFLAQEGAGRLDLPGGDAGAHWDSLRRLAGLGDDLRVRPGHDYHGLTDSPLGEERRRNPRFQRVTREEYIAWQRAVSTPTPDWMLDVIAANLGTAAAHEAHHAGAAAVEAVVSGAAGATACGPAGACATAATGRVPLISPRNAWDRLRREGGPFLLDVREPWEYHGPSGRHARGAVLLPLKALPGCLDEIPAGHEDEVLVICRTGGRSAAAAEFLIDRGFRRVFSVEGGTDRWSAEGLPVES